MKKFFKRFYLGFILVFLYVPILVLIVQSFNAGKSRAKWEGFSLRWYQELFQDQAIMNALQVTVSVALIAMVVSTILGTLAAIGIIPLPYYFDHASRAGIIRNRRIRHRSRCRPMRYRCQNPHP